MKVKLLVAMSGPKFNKIAGDVVEFDDVTAERLIERGIAEAVPAPKKSSKRAARKAVETAAAEHGVETATTD